MSRKLLKLLETIKGKNVEKMIAVKHMSIEKFMSLSVTER